MNKWFNKFKKLFSKKSVKKLLDEMILIGKEPQKIAKSLALGMAIGCVIPFGLQTFVSVPLAFVFQCNFILTVTGTLISNPLTLLPLYYVAYNIGTYLTGISLSFTQIEMMIRELDLTYFIKLGSDAIIVLITGTAVLAVFFSTVTYLSVYRLTYYYLERKRERKARSGDLS